MADFSFHSDTDESSSVDQILAEAMDHIVLEQVAAINCSSFSNSALPSHLESRFQRLKTFPSSSKAQLKGLSDEVKGEKPVSDDSRKTLEKSRDLEGKSRSGYASSPSDSSDSPSGFENSREIRSKSDGAKVKKVNPQSGYENSRDIRSKSGDGEVKKAKSKFGSVSFRSNSSNSSSGCENPPKIRSKSADRKVKKVKSQCGSVSFRSNSSNSSSGCENSPRIRSKSADMKVKKVKSQSGSVSFRSNSSNSSVETVKSGCFWCSPKKISRKKSGSSRNLGVELGLDLGNDDELLSDLRSFSSKEQKKLMKKAMKEEEKIIKEAEKIVKWAKQSSSRMDFSASDDELTD